VISWLKDPVTSFVIAGTAIFLLSELFSSSEVSREIKLSDSDVQRLSGNWRMQRNREPSQDELREIIEEYVKDEIYFRESQRLGLDVNDSIIRRRLVQKLTFLTEDIASIQPIGDQEVRAYFEENSGNYRVPKRFSFSHKYFSNERREDAKVDATMALGSEAKGDPFMLQSNYSGRTLGQIRGFLGQEFAEALAQLDPAPNSQGPIKSAYGWHTVKLETVEDSFIPDFATIAERVATDATIAFRSTASETYYDSLKDNYEVIYPSPLMSEK